MNDRNAIFAILIISAVTILLRFAPFLLFSNGKTPKIVTDLGDTLPYAVIGMLVIYCLKDVYFSAIGGWLPALIAGTLTVSTYIWKRSSLFSIVLGTVCYIALIRIL